MRTTSTTTVMFGLLTSLVLALAIATTQLEAQSGYDLFQKALATERADGNLRDAIQLYQRVVDGAKTDRALAAQALVRIADCYQKLGDTQARRVWELVAREYADQKVEAAEAKARLLALAAPAAAPASQTARLVWKGQEAFGSVRGTISADGRYLTYLDVATGSLAMRDLKANTSRILAQGSGVSSMFYTVFAPDGRRLAYAWSTRSAKDIQFDLRIIPANARDVGEARVVYRNEEMNQLRPFGWTPDGKHVLGLRSLRDGTNQIALISVTEGTARVLKSVPWNYTAMSLSPDGRFVAYEAVVGSSTSPSEILVLATDGSRETKVVQGPGVNRSPLWAPDGSRLLFLSNRTGAISLWTVPVADGRATGAPELARADMGGVRLQGITKSGTLHYLAGGVSRANVYIADLTAGTASAPSVVSERFINANSSPTWSPDGQQLAYLSERAQAGTVLVIRTMKTGDERDIPLPKEVLTGNIVAAPRWFPDGTSLLVLGYLPAGRGLFYRVDVATGRTAVLREANGLSTNGGLGASAISNDGKAIFYNASTTTPYAGESHLIRYDIETERQEVLTTGRFNAFALSPDGTQLALHRADGPDGCRLQVMGLGGGEPRDVVRTCSGVSRLGWYSASELLYVTGGNSTPNVIWRVPAAGGEPRQLGISMAGQLNNPAVTPDGRRLAFAIFDTGASEVWAFENFLPKATTKP